MYIANKTECFSFKSGRAIWVAKFIKEDHAAYNVTVRILAKTTFIKSFITRILEYCMYCYVLLSDEFSSRDLLMIVTLNSS